MDPKLEEMFDGYEFGTELDEEEYRRKAALVNGNFEKKMVDAGKKIRFAGDLVAMFRYFMDGSIPWQRKAIIVGALLYFILPLDAIPDIAPFVGYFDDFGVVAAVTKFMADQLAPYYPA